MNIEELHKYCMSIKGVTEDMPFNDKSIVYKIGNKIFCLALKPFDCFLTSLR